MRERPAHGEVDAVVARVHPRRVERARAVLRLRATAGRALVRLPVDALLEQEQLDAAVRRGLERLLPAGRGTAAASRLFLPAVDRRRLLGEPRLLEERLREREQLGRGRVPLARGRPHEAVARLGRELVDERRARFVRPDDDDLPGEAAANVVVEILRDRAQMLARELVDVPLEPRLRPAALVVPSGLLLGEVGQRLEPPARQLEEEAALAVDHGDDGAFAPSDERHERRDREVRPDADGVLDSLAERVRAPEPVEPGREQRDALHARAVELVREEVTDPLEVRLEPQLLVVRQLAPAGDGRPVRLVDERVDLRRSVGAGRRGRRVEPDEEADREGVSARGTPRAPSAGSR